MDIQNWEAYRPGSYDVRSELQRFIYNKSDEAFAAGDAARDAILNIDDLKARQEHVRKNFIESIGGIPSMDTDLNPRITGTIECDGYRIEKIIYQSRPDTYVTANLYIPNGITSPRGAVLFVCGHSEIAKEAAAYQNVCRNIVNTGLVVLAQDPIGQGERFSYYEKSIKAYTVKWGVSEHDYAGSQSLALGDCIARYFIHDAMRSIDYLCTRSEVDSTKIGITGSSGGGTQTALMMICDPRIAAAAPATFTMNRKTYMYAGGCQDAEQIWPKYTAMGFDHEDFVLMMAPRPVRVLVVASDFFCIEGARLTVDRTKRFWEMYGKADCLDIVEDESVHHYTGKLACAAAEFFSLHLLGNKITPDKDSLITPQASSLKCTKSGQVRGDYDITRAVHEENVDRLAKLTETKMSLSESQRKEIALNWLKNRVFSRRKQINLSLKHYEACLTGNLFFESGFWWSQEGLHNHAISIRDFRYSGESLPVTLAVWDYGTNCIQPHINWIRETCASGRAVVVLDTSGVGGLEPNAKCIRNIYASYGTLHSLGNELIWNDDSLAAIRIYDVTRSLDAIEDWHGLKSDDIKIYAYGRQGVYAQFASILDKRIKSIEVVDGFGNYADWVKSRHYNNWDIRSIIIPDLLKYMDISDIENWNKL